MNFDLFDTPRPEVTTEEAETVAKSLYSVSGVATPLSGERDRGFKLSAPDGGSFVIKFGNAADRSDALEAQAGAVEHAMATDPDLPLAPVVHTNAGDRTGWYRDHGVMLTTHLDGDAPTVDASPPELRRALGRITARLSLALRGYDHPVLHRAFPWDLTRLEELEPLLSYLPDELVPEVGDALELFGGEVAGRLAAIPKQAIHGDLHDDNVLVDRVDPYRIVGVFDFGDMTWGPRVCDLAVTATYQMFGADPAAAISQVASAFHTVNPLTVEEMDLLPGVVMGRCIQSVLMAARHLAIHPENASYAGSDMSAMLEALKSLTDVGLDLAANRVRRSCGVSDRTSAPLEEATLRRRALGPALELSYARPVRPVRGEGVWLIEADDSRYLDAYNNVPHVGHSHPQVVAAISAQTERLTTNTRYLVDSVSEYAGRIAALLPDPLSVVMFTNSGSEANDLAYQIATSFTGHAGVVTTENAYHGTTRATAAMSPEEFGDFDDRAARVRGRDVLHDADGAASLLSNDLDAALSRLHDAGPAMVIFDTAFSSEGIFEVPDGYLVTARDWADRCGALLVADEVQAGFGRVGPAFWGFQTGGVVPDIVTLGKPMGNGYPMGAVVTTSRIAEAFAENWHYFSTFAGSPVAAAAGMAVLDVVEDEGLAQVGQIIGDRIRQEVLSLAHPSIVEVRGPGLFVGVELTDPDIANRVKEEMRNRGVLIGVTGPESNVLKIRPPMVFAGHHVDILIGSLAESLPPV